MAKSHDEQILEKAAKVQAKQAEHKNPEVWKKARELAALGWDFHGFDLETVSDLDLTRSSYDASLGSYPFASQTGDTLASLVASIESWEASQAARKPEFRHPAVRARLSK